jgi:hypothetical protein
LFRTLTSKEIRLRTFVIVLIALAIPLFAGCGSGVTLGTDSPVDIPEQVEAGGVTVQTSETDVGGFSVDPEEDRITFR